MSEITRRRFIARSMGAVGAAAVASSGVRGTVRGANEQIRVGLIGCGGMGQGDLRTFLKYKDVACPIICDVDESQIDKTASILEAAGFPAPDAVKDFRDVIERNDVDVCLVATPDHWHALPTIHACQAGKDVYVEKPLATSIGEGRAMLDAARKHDRIVQMGTQWRSGSHYADAIRFVHSGKLGKIRQVRCWASLAWVHSIGSPPDGQPPEGVDYNFWLGPAPERPFNPARFHFSFRWFWDYAGGLMTDWGVHLINLAMWGMKAGLPESVSSCGGKYIYEDISETPDTQHTLYRYPDFTLTWEHQMSGARGCDGREHGVAFYGTEGTLILDASAWEVIPPTKHKRDRRTKPLLPAERHKNTAGDGRPEHVRNFLDCTRSRKRPVEDVGLGHKISTIAHLGNLALLTDQTIRWDADKERTIGIDNIDHLLTKPYRAPWKLTI